MKPTHVTVCGIRVPVRVASEKINPDLKDTYGYYDLNTGVIWINSALPVGSEDFWLAHEVLHVLLNSSGVLRVTAAVFGLNLDKPRDRKQMEVWEETAIRVLTPHLLESFGKVRRG